MEPYVKLLPTFKLPELSVEIVIGDVGIIPRTLVPFKIEAPVAGLLAVKAFCCRFNAVWVAVEIGLWASVVLLA